jgi:hypothetical protein
VGNINYSQRNSLFLLFHHQSGATFLEFCIVSSGLLGSELGVNLGEVRGGFEELEAFLG